MWKRLKYRGVDYGDFFMINEKGWIKRLPYFIETPFNYIEMQERIHKPKERFNLVVKPKNIRKDISIKHAVAYNFLPKPHKKYLYVYRYVEDEGNHYTNLYWSNQKSVSRDSGTYNIFKKRDTEKDRQIVEAYELGMTYKEMIKKFNTTRTYIRNALDLYGINRKQVRNRANLSIDLELAKELFKENFTLSQVGNALGISKYLASYYKGVLGFKKSMVYSKEKYIEKKIEKKIEKEEENRNE